MARRYFQTAASVSALAFLVSTGCKRDLVSDNTARPKIMSMRVLPPGIVYDDSESFSAGDVPTLLTQVESDSKDATELHVVSVTTGTAPEPALLSEVITPPDLKVLGYKQSRFLVDSRWATIRFLGEKPAGAGLAPTEMDQVQRQAFGTPNDTIPVVTAAWTINRIMSDFFAPMLETLPTGKKILKQLKIQGAYFAPGYVPLDGQTERDNAFIGGLQSLYIWPSSCFEREKSKDCPAPFLSTGHDPTVIGHETAHAVFNHLRLGKSLDGLQWAAVNEGNADYFSAAYFSEPVLGRIWKVSNADNPFLRTLTEKASANDMRYASEAHQFGVVWGSTLWRIRGRLIKELSAAAREVDRTMLYAITFLGETNKIRLGDAASAVLKSAEALDHTAWKKVMREEFAVAEIALSSNRVAADSGPAGGSPGKASAAASRSESPLNIAVKEKNKQVCGSIAGNLGITGVLNFIPLLLAILFPRRRRDL